MVWPAGLFCREVLVFLWIILNCHVEEAYDTENTQINEELVCKYGFVTSESETMSGRGVGYRNDRYN